MKKINLFLLIIFFFCCSLVLFSQDGATTWPEIFNNPNKNYWEIKKAFISWNQANANDSLLMDTVYRTKNYKKFKRFEAHYEYQLDSNGTFDTYNNEMKSYIESRRMNKSSGNCIGLNWKLSSFAITPSNSDRNKGMGIVQELWVNPNDTNHLLAATPNGGLWRTTNGGASWKNITDGIGLAIGVSTIAVNPLNTNVIYIGTGVDGYVTTNNGYGIYKSTDGGDTWFSTSLTLNGNHLGMVRKIVIDPIDTNKVYAIAYRNWNQIYPNGFYRSTDGFQSHTHKFIFNPFDIILKPSNPQVLKIIARDSIYHSTDGGLSFTTSSLGVLSYPQLKCVGDVKFAISHINPNTLAMIYQPYEPTCDTTKPLRIDISYNQGQSWNFLTLAYGNYKGGFKFSLVDSSFFYLGGILMYKYKRTDSNTSVLATMNNNALRVGYPNDPLWMHDDIRTIQILNINGKDCFYIGHDGGVSKSIGVCFPNYSNNLCWDLISDSLINTQYHGVGIHENDSNLFYGGAQDGTSAKTNDNGQSWIAGSSLTLDGDYGDLIYSQNSNSFRASIRNGRVYRHPGGAYFQNGSYQSRLAYHPTNSEIIFAGVGDFVKWNPNLPSPKWVNIFEANDPNLNRGSSVNYFSICESQTNVKVVATDNTTKNSGVYKGLLFKTNVTNPDEITGWTDITPHIPNIIWGQISTVELDPNNPDRMWIGVAGFSNSPAKERIFYTALGGADSTYPGGWIDFSAGLPNLPIQEINYQRGSNDLIYAATDVGVFYRDGSMSQWECFNNGLPPGVVNDIDISYCTGKMAISIYGRGAYKNNILNIPWEINTNTTWNEKRWLSVDLHVKSGKTLTIKDSLLIYPNVKIIVERGGKLIIDGGTLTTTCSNRFWHGIEVWGDASQWQESAGIQGELEIKNGALIENAYEAVGLIKTVANGNNDFAYTGGIIKASNSTFRNCRRAVRFYSYHNTQGSVTYPNKSYFYKMIFETTDLLKEEDKPEAFVSMHAVDHIYFYQCTFRNTVPHLYDENERGSAIKSWDATYSIIPTCSSTPPTNQACPLGNIQMSTFKGLYYGIDARAINPMNPITVDYAQFENCIRGIYQKGINFTSLTRNVFIIPDANIDDVYGIYSEGCYGYQIEENAFIGSGSGAERTNGICIYQSGTFDDEVYNNRFDELYIGALIMEQNGVEYSAGEGLELLCNDFTSFEYAIALTSNGIMDYHQGSMSDPTGNTFQPECPSGSGSESELYVDASSFPYEYYHHDNIITEPFCFTPTLVTTYNTGILYKSKIDECPSKLEPFCPDCSIIIPTGLGRSASANSTISNYEIKSKIRNFYKDTLLSNTRDSIVNFLGKNSLGLMNDYILAELELQKGNSITFKSKSNNLKVKGNYLPILDVLDWLENNSINGSSSNKITSNSQLIAASNSKKYGNANAENALTLISNNLYPETFVYPIKKKKVIGSQNKSKSADKKSVQFGIDIFPNPAKEQATISYHFDSKKQREIEVINNKGVVVDIVTVNNKDGQINIDLSNWAKGVYLFVVKNEADSNFIKRLVVTQ